MSNAINKSKALIETMFEVRKLLVRIAKHCMKRVKLYLTVRVPQMSIIVSKMIEKV